MRKSCTKVRLFFVFFKKKFILHNSWTPANRDSSRVKFYIIFIWKSRELYLSLHKVKNEKIMTIIEQDFMNKVPSALNRIARELERLNDILEKLAEKKSETNEKEQ